MASKYDDVLGDGPKSRPKKSDLDELADLYPVTYTPDFSNIIVAGKVRPLPNASFEDYMELVDRYSDDPETRKLFLSIAKFIADQESEHNRKIHAGIRYEKDLPETVRRLEAEVQDLKKQLRTLTDKINGGNPT